MNFNTKTRSIGPRTSCPHKGPQASCLQKNSGLEVRGPKCRLEACAPIIRGTLGLCVFVLNLFLVACRQDMHDQPKYEPLEKSAFFGDERASRPFVEGTIARGHLRDNPEYFDGKVGEQHVTSFPIAVTEELVRRGQSRYNIFCTPCHDALGNGLGVVVRRGFKRPPSFHIDRLRQSPPGYFYDIITNGFATMSSYAEQIPVQDRWAIVAYVRALQLSQHATMDLVPEEKRKELEDMKPQ